MPIHGSPCRPMYSYGMLIFGLRRGPGLGPEDLGPVTPGTHARAVAMWDGQPVRRTQNYTGVV